MSKDKIDDGGVAFPLMYNLTIRDDKTGGVAFPLMYNLTIRDYFAAKAIPGIITTFNDDTTAMPEQVACRCYAIADAMLAARKEDK